MRDSVEELLFSEMNAERAASIRAAAEDDPALRDAILKWQGVGAALRQALHERVPDRRLFVLYALSRSGHSALLSEEDRWEVERGRPELEAAVRAHPGLEGVVAHVVSEKDDFEQCWESFDTGRRPAAVRSLRWTWRVAAVFALVGLIGVMAYFLRSGADLHTVATRAGESVQVTLPDGSEVFLTGEAELAYDDAAFDRRVRLEGRAFMDVAASPEFFVVATPSAEATVLGTRFAVVGSAELTEVVLESGSLALAARGSPEGRVLLQPGQMSQVQRGAAPSDPVEVDLQGTLDWTGFFFFRATPMAEVAEQLEEAFGVRVSVDAALQSEAVSGTFDRREGLEHILTVLSGTLGAAVDGDAVQGYSVGL